MITVYADSHRRQDSGGEYIRGRLVPSFEMPRRADIVLRHVADAALGPVIAPDRFGLDPIRRVHDAGMVSFLETAWMEWEAENGPIDAFPNAWPAPRMSRRVPKRVGGKLGYYCIDLSTPITAGTWTAITASADVALTAAARVMAGERLGFGLCRPPGHHAGIDYFGGYCFLNNAAIAAQWLRDAGAGRVAILDVDYHHGNGTQDIFYHRDDVLFLSLHADPAMEYPYFAGHADEIGDGAGEGYNGNYPLPWGTAFDLYGATLGQALQRLRGFSPDAVVISLGLDTFEQDPISRFNLQRDDYRRMGEMIGALRLPTVAILEGGYAIDALGINAAVFLAALEGSLA